MITKVVNIVSTRIFTTNTNEMEYISKTHAEFFKNTKPATTIVEVKRFSK